jgi:hypothetical protein
MRVVHVPGKDLDSKRADAKLLVWWLDATGDTEPFEPLCEQGHKWQTSCEDAGHKPWTSVVQRSTVLAIGLSRGSDNRLTAESLQVVHGQVAEESNKRKGKATTSTS